MMQNLSKRLPLDFCKQLAESATHMASAVLCASVIPSLLCHVSVAAIQAMAGLAELNSTGLPAEC